MAVIAPPPQGQEAPSDTFTALKNKTEINLEVIACKYDKS